MLKYSGSCFGSGLFYDPLSLATDSGYVFFFIILYIEKPYWYLDLEKILSSG